MTVIHLGNNFYQGLAADTKPTNVPAGAIFRATDTGDIYHYNGSSWVLIVGASKTETLFNKTISGASNTLSNIPWTSVLKTGSLLSDIANTSITSPSAWEFLRYNGTNWVNSRSSLFPSVRRTGVWQAHPNSSSGEGLCFFMTATGTGVSSVDNDGKFVQFSTGGTLNNLAGFRAGTGTSRGDYNVRMKCKFKLSQTADTRLWIGWKGSADPSGDSTLNSVSGVLFGISVANNTGGSGGTIGWQLHHNDNTATATTTTLSSTTADTNIHDIEIIANNSLSKFTYSFDGAVHSDVPTPFPAMTTLLYPCMLIQTSAAVDKSARFYYFEIEQDK